MLDMIEQLISLRHRQIPASRLGPDLRRGLGNWRGIALARVWVRRSTGPRADSRAFRKTACRRDLFSAAGKGRKAVEIALPLSWLCQVKGERNCNPARRQ